MAAICGWGGLVSIAIWKVCIIIMSLLQSLGQNHDEYLDNGGGEHRNLTVRIFRPSRGPQ